MCLFRQNCIARHRHLAAAIPAGDHELLAAAFIPLVPYRKHRAPLWTQPPNFMLLLIVRSTFSAAISSAIYRKAGLNSCSAEKDVQQWQNCVKKMVDADLSWVYA